MREKIAHSVKKALDITFLPDIDVPERPEFGHYTTNVAMRAAKEHKETPHTLAEVFAVQIKKAAPELFERVEIAGPGFINFWVTPEAIREEFASVLKKKKTFGHSW
mgnify:CR=1 FL=1